MGRPPSTKERLAAEERDYLAARGKGDTAKSAPPPKTRNRKEPVPESEPSERLFEWRPFPLQCLPHPVRTFVENASAAIGCDAAMVALPLLAALAGSVGNTRRIRLKMGWEEPCVIWAAVVAPSGSLKSPAMDAAVKPLLALQANLIQMHQDEVHMWEEQVGSESSKRSVTRLSPPVCKRIICGDTTVEALACRLAENPRGLLLVRDELAGWLNSFGAYKSGKGGDAAHWLSMHGARDLLVDRKMGDRPTTHVRHAAVSITGGIQPEILRGALGREHFADGLAARLLVAMPPQKVKRWTEAEIGEDDLEAMDNLFANLLSLNFEKDDGGDPAPVVLRLTRDGKAEWVKFYGRHAAEQAGLVGDLAAAWSKLEGYCARFALLIHLVRSVSGDPTLESADAVDAASITAAVGLVEWFGYETRRVYGILHESSTDRGRQQLIETITRNGGRITPRELMRAASRSYPTAEEAEMALQGLVTAGFGNWEAVETAGRPKRVFVLFEC